MKAIGRVSLVGAGPGDPDLMTVKARRLIEEASVVVYDRLVSDAILDLIPAGAAKINVGKQPHNHPVPQAEINQMLVRLAKAGRSVVRLKGGDPLMFGRGGEEALVLSAAGVPFDIVPGITSAQGTAAALNVPLTHRGVSSSVRYLTGHCRADAPLDFDWQGLADADTTLVVYMGRANIAEIATELTAHGRAPETSVIAVANATRDDQSHLISTLDRIAADMDAAAPPGPVIFVIGEVVRLAASLGTLCHAPQPDRLAVAE